MGAELEAPVITHFREGVFNTMIATQIGEEGLDIGEVDLIINYDSNKSPIRMVRAPHTRMPLRKPERRTASTYRSDRSRASRQDLRPAHRRS